MDTQAHDGHDGHAHHDQPAPIRSDGLKDPVCGMAVTDQSQHRLEHDGRPYYFTGWLLSPMIAALAMSLSSASVIGNALRLRGAVLRQD